MKSRTVSLVMPHLRPAVYMSYPSLRALLPSVADVRSVCAVTEVGMM